LGGPELMGGPVIGSRLPTDYPLSSLTLKVEGCKFIGKRPTIRFVVSTI